MFPILGATRCLICVLRHMCVCVLMADTPKCVPDYIEHIQGSEQILEWAMTLLLRYHHRPLPWASELLSVKSWAIGFYPPRAQCHGCLINSKKRMSKSRELVRAPCAVQHWGVTASQTSKFNSSGQRWGIPSTSWAHWFVSERWKTGSLSVALSWQLYPFSVGF